MTAFFIVELAILIPVGFFLGYLAFLTVLAMFRKEIKAFPVSTQRSFAIVVPAHNEALIIEATLSNLLAIDYPKDRFEVIVVADNCDDQTSTIAAECGATVLVRSNPDLRGKGYALRWCFDLLAERKSQPDGLVVIDADSTVAKNFLTVMNHYMANGSKAIQCSDLAERNNGGWSSEMIRMSFLLYNHVRPLGRSVIGCSSGLKGNGMCFEMSVLREIPWDSFSLNEDLEYGLELLLNGIAVRFAPEAKLLAKMPQSVANAQSQRERWEAGRYPLLRKYGSKLLLNSIGRGSFRLFDGFVELVTPSLVVMLVVAGGMCAASLALAAAGVEMMWMMFFLWIAVFALGICHVIVGLLVAGADGSTFLSLLHVPRYFAWKLGVYLKVAQTGQSKEWVRTTREKTDIDPPRVVMKKNGKY